MGGCYLFYMDENRKNELSSEIAQMSKEKIEERLRKLPQGTLTYKMIKGKEQPYLQWTEDGKSKSVYIKVADREEIMELLDEKALLQKRLKRLKAYGERYEDILQHNPYIKREGGIGYQYFDDFMEKKLFYVDKTKFIIQWWERGVEITLLTRPRRFGKTLLLSTVENFFSNRYAGREAWFKDLAVGHKNGIMKLQGTYPVIFMTFAGIKEGTYLGAIRGIANYMSDVYGKYTFLCDSPVLSMEDRMRFKDYYEKIYLPTYTPEEKEGYCMDGLKVLSELLCKHYGKKVIILIDEYDTPLIMEVFLDGLKKMILKV